MGSTYQTRRTIQTINRERIMKILIIYLTIGTLFSTMYTFLSYLKNPKPLIDYPFETTVAFFTLLLGWPVWMYTELQDSIKK